MPTARKHTNTMIIIRINLNFPIVIYFTNFLFLPIFFFFIFIFYCTMKIEIIHDSKWGGGNVFIGQHKSHAGALSWTENELRNVFLRRVLDSEDTIRLLGQT